MVIDFRTQNYDGVACCNDIQIFGDLGTIVVPIKSTETDQNNEYHEIESSDTAIWYQSTYVMKGFKDTIVDGSSITNTWLSS